MIKQDVLSWLLEGDISIQFQTYRDLLKVDKPRLQKRIELEGWGEQFLSKRHSNGHWGRGFYQPKWTSSHYTLLDLKNLAISPHNKVIKATIKLIFEKEKGIDGGINPSSVLNESDICVNGMVLNYASYFQTIEDKLKSIIDFLLSQKMNDGGFNCRSNRNGAVHSSLHSTLSVLEGIDEYQKNGYQYRSRELNKAKLESIEFILMHHLFRSDHTGRIINSNFLKLRYPGRWYYDILKAMDFFQYAEVKYDQRMHEAIQRISSAKKSDGKWYLSAKHPGQTHFEMEKSGKPSRWNTLRSLRVLEYYQRKENQANSLSEQLS